MTDLKVENNRANTRGVFEPACVKLGHYGQTLNNQILNGLDLTFKRLIEKKIKENEQLVFPENGKIVYVDAKDIKLD